ncbi:MAG: ComF family protein, partial [Marinobacter sp.]|uniref:ComF family protein n=1 Tax=Marinobacter sp. TaxID=50741 RepID=UPI00299F3A1D
MIKGLLSLSTQFTPKVNSAIDRHTLCVACSVPSAAGGLCQACRRDLPANHHGCCRCALPLPLSAPPDSLCGECQADLPPFSATIAPWTYRFPVDQMIGRYKYHRQLSLGHALIRCFVDHIDQELAARPERRPHLLVPSPMHRSRQRRRGFNQAEDIAEKLSRRLGIPWSITLARRIRSAPSQSGLNRAQRQQN